VGQVSEVFRALADLDSGSGKLEFLVRRHALRAVIQAGFNLIRDQNAVECAVAVGFAFLADGADVLESAQRVRTLPSDTGFSSSCE